MKRLPMLLLVALMLTLSFAQAETPASTPAQTPVSTPAADLTAAQETTIRATGTESVSLPADIVVLTLCVQGSGDRRAGQGGAGDAKPQGCACADGHLRT